MTAAPPIRRAQVLPRWGGALLGALALLTVAGCKHIPTEREMRGAQIHYDLGVNLQQNGDVGGAVREFQQALELDDSLPEAHNAYALLMHLSFHRNEEAARHYKRALELRPTFSEAKVNLANLYLSEDRYDAAIKLYEDALNDTLYPTPYIAQNNLGWAMYKKGDVEHGVDNIKAAITMNPKFCAGYRNLGLIEDARGHTAESCRQFAQYRESCPTLAEASYREAVCLAKSQDPAGAKKAFSECLQKTGEPVLKDECRRALEQLSRGVPDTGNP